jgi:hypothetical protein
MKPSACGMLIGNSHFVDSPVSGCAITCRSLAALGLASK